MESQDFYEQIENTVVEESANVVLPNNSNTDFQYNQTFSVSVPKPGKKKLIDEACVEKIMAECAKAKKKTFPWAELLLGIATMFIGAFLSALISKMPYEFSFLSVLFYSICPILGIGCFVAYIFCRKLDGENIKKFAETVEENLQNSNYQEEEEIK